MATNTKIEKDEALIKTEDPTTAAISYQIPEYCYPPNGYYNLPNNLFQYGGIYNNYNCMGMYPNPQPFLSSSPLSVMSEHSDFLSGYKGDSLYSCMMEGYYPTECSQCLSYSYITYPNAIQTTPETSLSQLQASQSSEKNKASETDREDFYPSNDPSPSLQIKSFATYDKNNKLYIPGEVMGRPRLIPSAPMNGQRGVEDVFHLYMEMFFKNLPHPWCLFNIKSSQTQYQAWANFRDNCKVRFYCKDCRDGWTSMNGLIAFYYHISNEEQCGRIGYTICGQKCHHCKNSEFKDPLWYPDEAQKVIANLYYEIAFHCYNLVTPRKIRTQRPGAPKTRHSSSLCQGCTLGLCKYVMKKN